MQTFLPYASFTKSAQCLDRQRLGKQRCEAHQILSALLGRYYGWTHHPIAVMWRGYEYSLLQYIEVMCDEWSSRGYKNELMEDNLRMYRSVVTKSKKLPFWLGSRNFHASHRSNLLRKMPEHYRQFGWKEPDNLRYVWPKP